MRQVSMRGEKISLTFTRQDGSDAELEFDHVIAATGYRVNLQRLQFLHPDLRKQMATVEDVPILDRNFQTSVPGLFFVGLASSNSFGPLCRFAYGAKFTAKRLSRHLATCH
jgi:thioredoxin reductase